MKIKKIIAGLLITSLFISAVPTYSFAAKKTKRTEQTVISEINIDWWKDFNDPFLFEYITKAIQCNNDLKIATLKVDEATENKNITRSRELPSVGIGAVPALYKLPALTNSDFLLSLPIYANYELDLFGKNRDKTKSMDKLIEITAQNEKAAYISVTSAVGSTYYNIVKLDKLITLQEEIIKDRKQIYDLMKLSNEQGLVSTADTVSANKAYIKANTDIIELKKAQERMLNMLAVLTGDSPENSKTYKRIAFDDLNITKTIPDYIQSETIQSRPDYISAEKTLEKIGLDVRAAKKDFLPSFNILGLLSFNTTEFFSGLNWANTFGLVGGGATLPLFSGGAKIANLKLQKNKYKQAVENYKKTNITAIQEVNDALCDLKLDNEKYLKTLESYDTEKQDFYYTDLKYKEGIISYLDLLQKKEALLTTEKTVTNNKTELFINQIGLYKAVAGAKI